MKVKCLIASALLCSYAFATPHENPPECHFKTNNVVEANAGCLVVHNNKLLIIEDHYDVLSMPGGGMDQGEAAECTAEREVWEETGIEVKAGKQVIEFENGFKLFACDIVKADTLDGANRPMKKEVKHVLWFSLKDFDKDNWRFPSQVPLMQKYLKEHQSK